MTKLGKMGKANPMMKPKIWLHNKTSRDLDFQLSDHKGGTLITIVEKPKKDVAAEKSSPEAAVETSES